MDVEDGQLVRARKLHWSVRASVWPETYARSDPDEPTMPLNMILSKALAVERNASYTIGERSGRAEGIDEGRAEMRREILDDISLGDIDSLRDAVDVLGTATLSDLITALSDLARVGRPVVVGNLRIEKT